MNPSNKEKPYKPPSSKTLKVVQGVAVVCFFISFYFRDKSTAGSTFFGILLLILVGFVWYHSVGGNQGMEKMQAKWREQKRKNANTDE